MKTTDILANDPLGRFLKSIDAAGTDGTEMRGFPLGGIGTGTIELAPDGRLSKLAFGRGRFAPIEHLPGTFFGVAAGDDGETNFKLLASSCANPTLGEECLLQQERIRCAGVYPRCLFDFGKGASGAHATLTAFSPIVPRRYDLLCLPVAFFRFTIVNESERPIDGSLVFSWEDVCRCAGAREEGKSSLPEERGRFELAALPKGMRGFTFTSRGRASETEGFGFEEFTIATDDADGQARIYRYNPYRPISTSNVYSHLIAKGRIGDKLDDGRGGRRAAMLCRPFKLKPGDAGKFWIALAWHSPHSAREAAGENAGHYYANFYRGSAEIISRTWPLKSDFLNETVSWQNAIFESSLPDWMKMSLASSAADLARNGVWRKDGQFATADPSPKAGLRAARIFAPLLAHRKLMAHIESAGLKAVVPTWQNWLSSGNLDNLIELYPGLKSAAERATGDSGPEAGEAAAALAKMAALVGDATGANKDEEAAGDSGCAEKAPTAADIERPAEKPEDAWDILAALQGLELDVDAGLLAFRPNIPGEWRDSFRSPVACSQFWAEARWSEKSKGNETAIAFAFAPDDRVELKTLRLGRAGNAALKQLSIDGMNQGSDFSASVNAGAVEIRFKRPLTMQKGDALSVRCALAPES